MILEGVVTNVATFGAFVDIGVHQDGLVHVSRLADRFVKDPHEVVKPGDIVRVKVLEVDLERKRIALTMRFDRKPPPQAQRLQTPRPPRDAARGARAGAAAAQARAVPAGPGEGPGRRDGHGGRVLPAAQSAVGLASDAPGPLARSARHRTRGGVRRLPASWIEAQVLRRRRTWRCSAD